MTRADYELLLKLLVIARFAELGAAGLAAIGVALILLNCMNYECAGHYFLHAPFFRSRSLISAFGLPKGWGFGFRRRSIAPSISTTTNMAATSRTR